MYKIIFTIVIMISFISCQQNTTSSANFDKAKIAEEIRQVTNTIYQMGNDRNATNLYKHFSDSVSGVFDGTVMGSWEEHKKEGHAFFAAQKEIKYTIDSIYSIDVVSPEVAILTGSYSMTATDSTGNTISAEPTWTYVFNKIKGEWKVIHFHQSTKPN